MPGKNVDNMPTSYDEAHARLAGNHFRRIANNTALTCDNLAERTPISLVLHATRIVTWTQDGTVTLNSGGYQTVTTKARMNAALHGTRFGVTQKDFRWFVWDRVTDATFDFEDHSTWNLDRDLIPR